MLLPSSALKGLQTFCTAIIISLQNKRLPRWPFLMLHRGRDTSEVCLGSRQRNIQLLISLTLPELVETARLWASTQLDMSCQSFWRQLPTKGSFACVTRCAHNSFLLQRRHLVGEGSSTITTVTCTGPYHGSGVS